MIVLPRMTINTQIAKEFYQRFVHLKESKLYFYFLMKNDKGEKNERMEDSGMQEWLDGHD